MRNFRVTRAEYHRRCSRGSEDASGSRSGSRSRLRGPPTANSPRLITFSSSRSFSSHGLRARTQRPSQSTAQQTRSTKMLMGTSVSRAARASKQRSLEDCPTSARRFMLAIPRVNGLHACSPLGLPSRGRNTLKPLGSFMVVSIRSTHPPPLSYIFTELLFTRCFTRMPSGRWQTWLTTSPAKFQCIRLPRKRITSGLEKCSIAPRTSAGNILASSPAERNIRSVAHSS
jgi:hypothetical protein